MPERTIVITGASGNVGSALVRRLAEDGEHELVGIVRRPPGGDGPLPAMEWVAVDLTDEADTPALHAACELGQEIPSELFTQVAKVLAFVMQLRRRGSAQGTHRVPGALRRAA